LAANGRAQRRARASCCEASEVVVAAGTLPHESCPGAASRARGARWVRACAARRGSRRAAAGSGSPAGGILDIGTPPFADLLLLSIAALDGQGDLQQVEAIPAGLGAGPLLDLQGAVLQPSGCLVVLTAAFYGTGQ
jgi:hypothetical protein